MPRTIKIGTASAEPGEFGRGIMRAGELRNGSPVEVSVMIVNGVQEGPRLYMQSTVHGAEIGGIEVIRRIFRKEITPSKLRGSIIGVPIGNPLAYEAVSRTSPHDDGNLWTMFPGRPDGSITQRLANIIWNEAIKQSAYVLDIHCISPPGLHNTIVQKCKDQRTMDSEMAMASAYGVTTIGYYPPVWNLKGTLQYECLEAGIPCLTPELTDARSITEEAVESGVTGVLNVLKLLNMIDGKPQKQTITKVLDPNHVYVAEESLRANRSGTLQVVKPPGEEAAKGEVIAKIFDAFGDEVEAIKIPFDGYVSTYPAISWIGYQAVGTGDFIADLFHK